jgi:glycosyltransferase involved in cell wall biosynthesis
MKVLQINVNVNSGSTGRIAEDLGELLIANGHESFIAYGRGIGKSKSKLIKIGNVVDIYVHGVYTLLADKHGFASKCATKKLIENIEILNPDIIALHNLHGYFINIELLFDYLKRTNKPVVWTLFDCWAFTGHCTYFEHINCLKWQIQCYDCPLYDRYPASYIDNSKNNFTEKKRIFTSLNNMELVVHSNWLGNLVSTSFLSKYKINVTPSGINIDLFKPMKSNILTKFRLENKKIILGCASVWNRRKGLEDFIKLSSLLSDEFKIVLIGLNKKQIKSLPENIIAIKRTESIVELAEWYSASFVFLNPTTSDNFPTTNIEALACGTPVITYNTGGSPEAIDVNTGIVVEKGNVNDIVEALHKIGQLDYKNISNLCRKRAEQLYAMEKFYANYISIFERLTDKSVV